LLAFVLALNDVFLGDKSRKEKKTEEKMQLTDNNSNSWLTGHRFVPQTFPAGCPEGSRW
jgi:hypothetical protein